MKSFYRKISAVALASMMIFGGVAVSSVQSFAGSLSLINVAQRDPEQDWQKIDDYFKEIHRLFKVDDSAGSRSEAKLKANKLYAGVQKYQQVILKLNDSNFEKRLRMLSSEFDAFIVEYNGMFYLISNKYYAESKVKEESAKVEVKKEKVVKKEQKQAVVKPIVKKEEVVKPVVKEESGYSGSISLIGVEQRDPVQDWEKIDEALKGSGYKVFRSYGSRGEAKREANQRYAGVRRYLSVILKLDDKNFEKRLQMLVNSYQAFVVEYNGMFYLIDNLK